MPVHVLTLPVGVNEYLLNLASEVIYELETEGCCTVEYPKPGAITVDSAKEGKDAAGKSETITPCVLGHIASYYYLSYRSVGLFDRMLPECGSNIDRLTRLLADAFEYVHFLVLALSSMTP